MFVRHGETLQNTETAKKNTDQKNDFSLYTALSTCLEPLDSSRREDSENGMGFVKFSDLAELWPKWWRGERACESERRAEKRVLNFRSGRDWKPFWRVLAHFFLFSHLEREKYLENNSKVW